jgi:cyclophilin family peptidyl-prolyl cis-trans isomerase
MLATHFRSGGPGEDRAPASRCCAARRTRRIPAFAGTTKARVAALVALSALATASSDMTVAADVPAKPKTMADVLAASKPSDWRTLDPENTLYMDLPAGRVVIELAPRFAPLHAKNIRLLAREHYFDGLAILRVQDNFVTQWGDPDGDKPAKAHPLGKASKTLAPEFERDVASDVPFTRLPDADVYAPEVGFSDGMPAARDPKAGKTWLAHCYGMVGAGRDVGVDTGPGTELYVVIGHAPRQLDRNIAVVGRVVQGMELLSALPRGTGPLGFYEKSEQRVPIRSVRVAADVPAAERTNLEVLRTDTQTFADLVESRRNRRDEWYKVPAGRIDLCNVPVPVRTAALPK